MLANTIKIIYRNWLRDKTTTLINILGLSFSLLVVFILAMHIIPELQVDRFHQNLDRIYGVFNTRGENSQDIYTHSPVMLGELLKEQVPEVLETVRIKDPWEVAVLAYEGQAPLETELLYADASFFKVFTYQAIAGDLNSALEQPMSIVLTENEAQRLFGNSNPIGEIVKLDNQYNLTVTAVIKSPASKSALSFKCLVSVESLYEIENFSMKKEWDIQNFVTFALTKKDSDIHHIAQISKQILPNEEDKENINFNFYPYKNIYFGSIRGWNFLRHGSLMRVNIFIFISILILFIALINFINLSTAKTLIRSKESGIIKTIGASQTQIIFRFVLDSALLAFISLSLTFILIKMGILHLLSQWLDLSVNTNLIDNPFFMICSSLLVLFTGIGIGILPGLKYSHVSPGRVLQKKLINPNNKNYFTWILFTFQFVIAIILICSALIITRQIQLGGQDWNIRTENIIGIKMSKQLGTKKDALRNELMNLNGIDHVTFSQFHPGNRNSHWTTPLWSEGSEKNVSFQILGTEPGIFDLFNIQLKEGRFFSQENQSDLGKVVINQTAAQLFNLNDPLKAKLKDLSFAMRKMMGDTTAGEEWMEIVGIVEDFHFQSKHEKIAPLVIQYRSYGSWCYLSLSSANYHDLKTRIEKINLVVKNLAPDFPAEIEFIDQSIDQLYRAEYQFQKQFMFFAISAIVISCMGLLGLSIFTIQKRTKEIGIRKVLGSSASQLIRVLTLQYLKWVIFSNIIALPIAFFAMKKWLQNFAYQIDLTIWPFLTAGLIAVVIALITVSWQTIRSALTNPVDVLKYE